MNRLRTQIRVLKVICNFAKSYRNENDTGAQKSLSEQRYRVLQGQVF